jgi:hypothetical protein
VQLRKLFAFRRESLAEVDNVGCDRAQILHSVPTLFKQPVRSVEGLFHQLPRRLVWRNVVGRRLKSPDQPLHPLKQRVVKIARNPFTLGQSSLKDTPRFCADLRDAQPIECRESGGRKKGRDGIKPPRLIPRGDNPDW